MHYPNFTERCLSVHMSVIRAALLRGYISMCVTVLLVLKACSTCALFVGFVRKKLMRFATYHSKYATFEFLRTTYEAIAEAAAAGGATHLVHPKAPPTLKNDCFIVDTAPVGVAFSDDHMPDTEEEAKRAIRGVVEGCGELHLLSEFVAFTLATLAWTMVCPCRC